MTDKRRKNEHHPNQSNRLSMYPGITLLYQVPLHSTTNKGNQASSVRWMITYRLCLSWVYTHTHTNGDRQTETSGGGRKLGFPRGSHEKATSALSQPQRKKAWRKRTNERPKQNQRADQPTNKPTQHRVTHPHHTTVVHSLTHSLTHSHARMHAHE